MLPPIPIRKSRPSFIEACYNLQPPQPARSDHGCGEARAPILRETAARCQGSAAPSCPLLESLAGTALPAGSGDAESEARRLGTGACWRRPIEYDEQRYKGRQVMSAAALATIVAFWS